MSFRGYSSRLSDGREGIHLCAADDGSTDHAGCYQRAFADASGATASEKADDLADHANAAVADTVTVTAVEGGFTVSVDFR